MKKIIIELSDENYEKSLNLVHVLNYLNKNHRNEISIEELIEASLFNYLERFYDHLVSEHKYEELVSLGNPNYHLRFNLERYIEDKGLPLTHMAKQLKISLGALKGIIDNKHMPSVDIFIRLWVLIGCPPLQEILYRETKN